MMELLLLWIGVIGLFTTGYGVYYIFKKYDIKISYRTRVTIVIIISIPLILWLFPQFIDRLEYFKYSANGTVENVNIAQKD